MNVRKPTNVIITGVGGQGNVLGARVVAEALLESQYEVAVGDVFGLSQRGGAVASHLRFWKGAPLPPLVPSGHLDILLGFEPMEALRILCQFGSGNTQVLVSGESIPPMGVLTGAFEYPPLETLLEHMRGFAKSVEVVNGIKITRELGHPEVLNMVMVGALIGSGFLPLSIRSIEKQIRTVVPKGHKAVNCEALRRGIQAIQAKNFVRS